MVGAGGRRVNPYEQCSSGVHLGVRPPSSRRHEQAPGAIGGLAENCSTLRVGAEVHRFNPALHPKGGVVGRMFR